MDVAIISDTHIPSREQQIPDPFHERVAAADHVLHAGDFDAESTYANIEATSAELTAVAGNMDPRFGLPAVATVELGGVEFVLTHGTGSPRGYEQRVASTVREHAETADPVGVSGHTHRVLDTTRDGIRLLNPGSATGAHPASRTTMMTAEVDDGDIAVELHEL